MTFNQLVDAVINSIQEPRIGRAYPANITSAEVALINQLHQLKKGDHLTIESDILRALTLTQSLNTTAQAALVPQLNQLLVYVKQHDAQGFNQWRDTIRKNVATRRANLHSTLKTHVYTSSLASTYEKSLPLPFEFRNPFNTAMKITLSNDGIAFKHFDASIQHVRAAKRQLDALEYLVGLLQHQTNQTDMQKKALFDCLLYVVINQYPSMTATSPSIFDDELMSMSTFFSALLLPLVCIGLIIGNFPLITIAAVFCLPVLCMAVTSALCFSYSFKNYVALAEKKQQTFTDSLRQLGQGFFKTTKQLSVNTPGLTQLTPSAPEEEKEGLAMAC